MMNEEKEYVIWRMNPFNHEIPMKLVARFYDLELAKEFVEYQATIGEHFDILQGSEKL